jgi:hypothetical protein
MGFVVIKMALGQFVRQGLITDPALGRALNKEISIYK